MDAGEATRLYGELQKAAPLEALRLGTDSQQERAERAQALQEVEIGRHEAIYRAAFGSTVDPDPDHLFGLALNVRHAGNMQAVLADPDLEFAFARVLDVHTTEVFVNDEDGQRWEPSSPRSDGCVETGFQVALADLRGGRDVRHADFERAVDEASRSLDGELVEPLSPKLGLKAEPATHVQQAASAIWETVTAPPRMDSPENAATPTSRPSATIPI